MTGPTTPATADDPLGRNWSRSITFGAARIHRPTTVTEVQEVVSAARRIRLVGTAHSFNDLVSTDDSLLSLDRLDQVLGLDTEARTVTVEGGIRYHQVARWLEQRGWALHNMASIPHFSVAGACATGTHGSGDGNGELAAAVAEIELVDGTGQRRHLRRGDPDFGAAVVSLGALGAVTRLVLDIEPSYRMAQELHLDLPLGPATADVDAIMASAYSVSWFLDWRAPSVNQLWRKHRLQDDEAPETEELAWGGRRAQERLGPRGPEGAELFTDQQLTVLPWLDVLPHIRIDGWAAPGSELQSEYFVDRAHGRAALEALARIGETMSPVMRMSEIRTVAAGDQWLSPFARDRLALHLSWQNDPAAAHAILPVVEEALAPFDPVPHWGKLYRLAPAEIRSRYPRFAEFVAVADRFDPEHVFRNPHLDALLG